MRAQHDDPERRALIAGVEGNRRRERCAGRAQSRRVAALVFTDLGGPGYATVRASPRELETELVCIPRPLERNDAADGGPLVYRAVHRVRRWRAGERPELRQEIVEGDAGLAI